MSARDRLQQVAQELREGKAGPELTVRDLLGWFNAQRRGYWIVADIRHGLSVARLQTDPDFESVYIDAPISFKLASAVPPDASASPPAQSGAVVGALTAALAITKSQPSYADPTYRISKLEAANKQLVRVAPDACLDEAVTLMLSNCSPYPGDVVCG